MSSAGRDGPRDMTDRDPALVPYDALVGTWATEATHPKLDAVVPGEITFEWLEGDKFLVQRSRNDHELFPGRDHRDRCSPRTARGSSQEYFDSRGVRRTYGTSFEDGVLRFWRDHPTFAQRFSATVAHDSFVGQ